MPQPTLQGAAPTRRATHDRQKIDTGQKIHAGRTGKSRDKISVDNSAMETRWNTIPYYLAGATCRNPAALYVPPLDYKRESTCRARGLLSFSLDKTFSSSLKDFFPWALKDISNTSHNGRRVLHSGGPHHSKSLRVLAFLHHIRQIL